jgi:uncharacterized protein
MNSHLRLLASLLASACVLAMPLFVVAAEVTGLYQAKAPLTARDDERARNRAFAIGLRDTLIRVTGRDDVMQEPLLQGALTAPQSLVESWSYQTQATPDGASQQLVLQIGFYEEAVQNILTNAGIAVWPAARPETLVWLMVQEPNPTATVDEAGLGGSAIDRELLQSVAARRALPLGFPAWDYEDSSLLLPALLWNQDEATLRAASMRYNNDSILALRLQKNATGTVTGKAVHIFRDKVQMVETVATPIDEFLDKAFAMAAGELAANYAVRLGSAPATSETPAAVMHLRVDGIVGLKDYADVLHYLQAVPGIRELQLEQVEGDVLTFNLLATDQLRPLLENLALGRKVQALKEPAQQPDGSYLLSYRWLHL